MELVRPMPAPAIVAPPVSAAPAACSGATCGQCGRGGATQSLESRTVEELLSAWSRFNARFVTGLLRREQSRLEADADQLLCEMLAFEGEVEH